MLTASKRDHYGTLSRVHQSPLKGTLLLYLTEANSYLEQPRRDYASNNFLR